MDAAISGLELAAGILKIIPPACQVASMIYEKAMDMHNKFKTEKNNTPGTEAQSKQQEDMIMRETGDEMGVISIGTESQIKQQGQMMSEMRDEMRDISITSKLSLEMISKVFMQVHIFNQLSLWVLRWKLLKHKLPSSTHSRATTNWKLFYQCGVSG